MGRMTASLLALFAVAISWSFCAVNAGPGASSNEIAKAIRSNGKSKGQATYESVLKPGPWSYSNTTWAEWPTCTTGKRQSPVNVLNCRAGSRHDRPAIKMYKSSLSFHAHTEHYALDCENKKKPCSKIDFKKKTYKMLQMHGHSPGENTLNGRSYPVEIHFVHADPEGALAVIGVFFKIGKKNREFQKFVDAAAQKKTVDIDISKMYDPRSKMSQFAGSLTTPPCTEGVTWFVSWGVQEISKAQYRQFRQLSGQGSRKAEPHNRPVQPLNDRAVKCFL